MTDHLYDIIAVALIISAIVSIPLIIILYLQLRDTKIQTSNLGKEIEYRTRPWFKIHPLSFQYAITSSNRTLDWQEYIAMENKPKINKISFTSLVENIGSIPSEIVYIKRISTIEPLTKENFFQMKLDYITEPMVPGETIIVTFEISWEEYLKLNERPMDFGIHVGYSLNYDLTEFDTIGKIWRMTREITAVPFSWISEPD